MWSSGIPNYKRKNKLIGLTSCTLPIPFPHGPGCDFSGPGGICPLGSSCMTAAAAGIASWASSSAGSPEAGRVTACKENWGNSIW